MVVVLSVVGVLAEMLLDVSVACGCFGWCIGCDVG